ncbi:MULTISPECIES: TonB-dependent receptor [Pacificimonas]|nr:MULTISPECIES: TonB-dependent receptor [Pacificimonas]MBZ6378532.1 TonB-dependent receptor [Pacificimonas aurantium]
MRKFILLSGTAVLFASASPASAQTESQTEDDQYSGDVIVVTALKREQSITEVPTGISVLGGQELEERGIETIQDLSFAVPGLTMREDGPGSYTIFLRGLANQSGSGALVGMYLDEAPLSLSGYDQLSPATLDFERVEVLKGPQGTLYGQNSAGGVVRFISNKPDLYEVGGSVSGELYTVEEGEVGARGTAVVNLPVSEGTFGIRLAALYEDGGGWIDQPEAGIEDGNGTQRVVFRGRARWQPSRAFTADAMVQVHRADTKLGAGYEEPDRTVDIGADRSKVLIPKQFDFTIYNLELNYDFGFAQLVSSTTYADHDHDYPFPYIARPGNVDYGYTEGNDDRYIEGDQFSQELRLVSDSGPLAWTLGAFYTDGDRSLTADYEYVYAPNGDLYEGGGVLYDDLYYYSENSSETYAFFADAAYDLTDRLTVGAGVRYFHDEQTSLIEYAPGTGTPQEGKFESTDPRVYASYDVSDDASIYASFGEGFRSGGFNTAPFDPYGPEDIATYEIGTRGAVMNGAVRFDIAAFHTDYNDMIRRRLVNVNGQLLGESSNIGKVEAEGVELGLQVEPVRGLTLGFNGAYIDSEVVDTAGTDPVNDPGDRTDYVPKFSSTVSAQYDFLVGGTNEAFFRVDWNHRDKLSYIDRSSFIPSALPQTSDELDLINMRLGFDFGQMNVELYGQNLTDQNKAIDPYVGWANSNRTRPRTFGVKLGREF